MNPPAAIHSAMGRERKPFTYTPGGLDLSEIKSERMARRLMRNAMSPGVQEATSPVVQSPTGAPPNFPQAAHYNNLPVQVFPAFQLPANPKVLLRTRSTPHRPRENSEDRTPPQYMYAPPPTVAEVSKNSFLTSLPPVPRRSSTELSPLATANLGFGYPPQVVTLPAALQTAPQVSAHPQTRLQNVLSNGTEHINTAAPSIILEPCLRMPSEILQSNTEDKRAKAKKKNPSEDEVEVEATVKITKPKKTISTSVEIERKILSDGTVEETKTTTTNTIINGKVEDSKVQKETRILSTEEAKAVIQEESEEEEEEVEEEEEKNIQEASKKPIALQNGLSKESEVSVKTETKKTVVTTETKEETKSDSNPESKKTILTTETKVETKTEANPETNKTISTSELKVKTKTEENSEKVSKSTVMNLTTSEEEEEEEEEEVEESEQEEEIIAESKPAKTPELPTNEVDTEKEESEEEEEEVEEEEIEVIEEKPKPETVAPHEPEADDEAEQEEEEEETEIQEEVTKKKAEIDVDSPAPSKVNEQSVSDEINVPRQVPEERDAQKSEPTKVIEVDESFGQEKDNVHIKTETSETKTETITTSSVPEVHTTTKKESTEISSSVSDNAYGTPVSTQTELHRTENIVTVNKTFKSLDNTYEQLTQHGVPTVRTYFAPPTREKLSTSPLPAKPFTPTFPQEKKPERRHSLLLDRLSHERQVAPPESYQNTYSYQSNQSYESVSNNQLNQEPQSEVVSVSNVKPSSINNSQWYQTPPQTNTIYNNVQPTTPNAQQYQQPAYNDHLPNEPQKFTTAYQAPEAPSYSPKPSTWGSSNLGNLDRLPSINAQSNQYSFMSNKTSTETYTQQSTAAPHFSSGYVPPPWESEKSGLYQEPAQQYYQPPTTAPVSSNTPPSWKPTPQQPNYTKTNPVCYQPPAPNASFVKQGTPTPKQTPGRKTYYSEYERRYISVPESTYIPPETKVQPQWDASPQYYYDNPEPAEEIEQPWRKELREFTEKTTKLEETTTVQPPWQEESNYPKNSATQYTPQPTWSQTLRPRSYKEKSFDAETLQYQNTQEWPKSNTLNRRPVSAFVKARLDSPGFERARGVSVDRYNANSYQPPAPYTPSANNGYSLPWETQEQAQVISPTPQHYIDPTQRPATGLQSQQHYHNPQVPAYHVRAPTEPREYHASYQPRWSGQGRERPVQSRSFKYLQMLTGTEDGLQQPEPFVAQQPHHAAPRPRRV